MARAGMNNRQDGAKKEEPEHTSCLIIIVSL
jgi:hypothetical protein